MKTTWSGLCCACLTLLALAAPGPRARGDVVTLATGERFEGIATTAPGDAESVLFHDSKGDVKFSRGRIRSIEDESDAVDWMRVGDQDLARRRYEQAIVSYRKALAFDPSDAKIQERINQAQAAVERVDDTARLEQFQTIDALLDRTTSDILAHNFLRADDTLTTRVFALGPSLEQKARIANLTKTLHRTWAKERLDKLDSSTAAEHFQELLKLDPTDEEAYRNLVEIWGGMSDKSGQVVEALKMQLMVRPEDKNARKKLADKYFEQKDYDKALEQYSILYDSGEFKGTEIEQKMADSLTVLYKNAANARNFDKAIENYTRLQKLSPQAGDDTLHELEFWRDALKVGPDNVEERLNLAFRARSQGLNALATSEINRLWGQFPDNEKVKAARKTYADEALAQAKSAFDALQYDNAITLATRCKSDYGDPYPDIAEECTKIVNNSRVEIERARREKSTMALEYKAKGDADMQMALAHVQNLKDPTMRNPNVYIVSDKQQAIKYFRLARDWYRKALDAGSGLDDATRQEVGQSLSTVETYLNSLASNKPLPEIRRTVRDTRN